MTLFMPPIQRKKKVDEKYNPDTFRVMSEDAVSDHPKYRPLPYRASFEPRTPTPKVSIDQKPCHDYAKDTLNPLKSTRVLPQPLLDYRAHRPQAKSCGFLDKNVRFLNEPICNVYTEPVQHEEGRWWPSRANPGSLVVPPYAEDTHYRIDYNYRHGEHPGGSSRHSAHLNREAALGTVPVNYLRERDGSQRFYKEGLSYEHMYNSRSDTNYPIRGKRHGAFVWNRMDPVSQRKFIEYYTRLEEEEKRAAQSGQEGPSSIQVKTGSAPVIRSANHKPLSPIKTKQLSGDKVLTIPTDGSPKQALNEGSSDGATQNCTEQPQQVPDVPKPDTSAAVTDKESVKTEQPTNVPAESQEPLAAEVAENKVC